MKSQLCTEESPRRRHFLGGSDARIIMSGDEAALIRLWKEKRGEVEPQDLSDNLVVQLGVATEALNRTWYERNTGRTVTDVQRWVQHPVHRFLAATLDGMVEDPDAVFEAKFMLPWSFSEEAAAENLRRMWPHAGRSTSSSLCATSRARTQSQRRIHRASLSPPPSRVAPLRRRGLVVGRGQC
jgi:hypothetical protein